MDYITITDEQYAAWDGTPEDLAAIAGRPDLAHALLGDEATHVPGGRSISIVEDDIDTSKAAAALGRAGRGASKVRGDSDHYRAIRAKRVTVWGYRNVAYFPGSRPDGYAIWYPTRALRDEALRALRADAIAHGLSGSASLAGIYPIVQSIKLLTDDQREDLGAEGSVRTN